MRIAIFIKNTTLHKHFGGLETQNKLLAEGFAKKGHEVVVFSPRNELSIGMQGQNGVSYIFIPAVYRMGIFFQGFEQKLAAILGKVFPFIKTAGVFSNKGKEEWIQKSYEYFKNEHDKKKFDVVLCQSSSGTGIIRKKKALGVPVISISHGTILGEYKTRVKDVVSFKKFLSLRFTLSLVRDAVYVLANYFGRQREFILHSDKVVAVSSVVKQAIIDETFVPEDRVEVIFNGIDASSININEHHNDAGKPDNLRQAGSAKGEYVRLIYVGRIERSKGLFLLVEVMGALGNTNIKLDIIGDGPDFDELKKLVSDMGLDDVVILQGKKPHEKIGSFMSNSDIFVLPSLRVEGFPMTLVEAMFSSLPIVAASIGGIVDAIDDNATGVLVKSGDSGQLKVALERLIADERLRKKMGTNGKLKAQNNFTLKIMIEKYESLIKTCVIDFKSGSSTSDLRENLSDVA